MTFSERLHEMMIEKGITKYRLAKDMKISATTISNYLNNKTKPDLTKLEVLSEHLGVNRVWLLRGEGEKYRHTPVQEDIYTSAISVREDDSIMSRYLASIVDKQASMLKVKDEHLGRLIAMHEMVLDQMIPLLEKISNNK